MDHLLEPRRLLGWSFTINGHPYGFPFRRLEYGFAVNVRTTSTQVAHEQSTPRHNQIKPQCGQDSVDVLEASVFDPATRFQGSKQNFRLPAIMPPKTKAVSGSGGSHSLLLEPEEFLIAYFFFRTFGVVNSAGIG
jgi:hypothetical protein